MVIIGFKIKKKDSEFNNDLNSLVKELNTIWSNKGYVKGVFDTITQKKVTYYYQGTTSTDFWSITEVSDAINEYQDESWYYVELNYDNLFNHNANLRNELPFIQDGIDKIYDFLEENKVDPRKDYAVYTYIVYAD